MKILIIGPLGAGKSSLAYAIQHKFGLPRLNLDEVCRNPANGAYYPTNRQLKMRDAFLQNHPDWVAEGCQKHLYDTLMPDVIIDMRINRFVAIVRFTARFWKAKKLIGRSIDKNLPVQAYHYRETTVRKIKEYDKTNQAINAEITTFLTDCPTPVLTCQSFKDYPKIFDFIRKNK